MKKTTKKDHLQRVNEVLYQIHLNITKEHSVNSLASLISMSPFHFNRVFKNITNESLHTYVRRVRLEHSANVLLFNPDSSITEILQNSGFVSNSSFTHAFKEYFGVTPTKWREVDISKQIKENIKEISPLHVEVCYFKKTRVAYVRHKGYDRSINEAWMRLFEFCNNLDLKTKHMPMIGLHHSNPNIVQKRDCHYVACLGIKSDKKIYPSAKVGIMNIPKIFCAKFILKGAYGDLMKYMDYIYYKWLPNSGYEKMHLPSLAHYRANHFINKNEKFDLDFYVPIKYKN
ncbi:MAG: AraC family transcriptional regulator [Sulfurospirillum sp.]